MGSFMDKMSNSFLFGKHYRIERFGVMVISIFLVMCLLAGVCLHTSIIANQASRAATAMYTTDFATSRTGVTGRVAGIYRSEDGKGCMVMLQFNNIATISIDANNYQLFLTSADVQGNPRYMTSAPSGSIYMFGSSGYMGIYLYSETGFGEEILDLVVRCNSELVSAQNAGTVREDASFDKFDQLRVYFNPSGTDATVASCLNNNEFTLFEVYEELICRQREETLHETLQADLEKLKVDLAAISEYENRLATINLDGASIIVPERPEYILGDSVTDAEDGSLIYTCEKTVPRGVNFNWQVGSVKEGYLTSLVPEGMTYAKWVSDLNKQTGSVAIPQAKDWYLTDGSCWADYTITDTIGPSVDINNTINLLTGAYQTYFTDKQTYQATHLRELLTLELEARNVESNYSINASEDVLRLY